MKILVLLICIATTSHCQRDEKWIWGYNENEILPNDLIIPGYVEPTTRKSVPVAKEPSPITEEAVLIPKKLSSTMTAPPPIITTSQNPITDPIPITTFHPSVPYLVGQKLAKVELPPPKTKDNGLTTKSRIVEDTFDETNHIDDKRYTTLDKLFAERGKYDASKHVKQARLLGGLDPREVFYTDDDILIIRGGGFFEDLPEEQLQSLDEQQNPIDQQTGTAETQFINARVLAHEEYNGNIPSILPSPILVNEDGHFSSGRTSNSHIQAREDVQDVESVQNQQPQTFTHPLVLHPALVRRASHVYFPANSNYMPQRIYRPHVQNTRIHTIPYKINTNRNSFYITPGSTTLLTPGSNPFISLHGDTDVNYLHPRPPQNPDAEVIQRETEEFLGNSPQIIRLHQVRQNEHLKPIL